MSNWTKRSCLGLLIGAFAGLGSTVAMAGPQYGLIATIPVPSDGANKQPLGAFTSFDISYFDPATGNVYVADRSNASVDIFSGSSLSFLGRATGFTGQQATTSVSGADGVVTVTSGATTTLYAGDGNSTLKVFDATNPAAPSLLTSISSGGSFRVDEMAYSPLTHQVLAANNADAPAFATLFTTTNGTVPVTKLPTMISIPGAAKTDGLEQPVWDPFTQSFFVSVPAFNGDQGGVAEILTNGTVGRLYKFSTMANGPAACGPAGLAVGSTGHLLVGCSAAGSQAVLLDPTGNGTILSTFPTISGTDELWFDPTTGDFFVTGASGGKRVFAVISDALQSLLTTVPLPVASSSNPHSITVDSLNGDVFVPLAGSTATIANAECPLGCIAVFAPIPEPSSWSLSLTGLLALLGVAGFRLRFG